MLQQLSGIITSIEQSSLVIEVGGIGFLVCVAYPERFSLDAELTIPVYLHWNQEQGPSLFGFVSVLDKQIFMLIISCSGLGPKIGLAILSGLGAAPFLQAIQQADSKILSTVPGIGLKKAEQIIVQLKHKVDQMLKSGVIAQGEGSFGHWSQVTQVLHSLNYSHEEISQAMSFVGKKEGVSQMTFDQLMRSALSFLAKKS